ncbi:nitronate monooxygenase [Mycolicibacterium litorale]|uniref:Propionate 3-nitronate monooxygenase n=1 Tax=Mycolicibacterium litorale TaxID=758802 RepID=A0AAD1INK8_9MYCO|nr:nitronate monooxygenase [Mycolicibacterium litorale]MCV7416845.1 nitronate monooxygenase [Mycolicibacterium litorale]TDY04630.1 nitroalkane oxidase [Mycolicibacterium litorale]BBY18056.1 oxidoreductase [Mycolicibacterium litorale]
MTTPLTELGVRLPVIAAPMAGGATTTAMVIAAAEAGSLGLLAAGYKTPEALQAEITAVRAAPVPFGVNVFAPNPVPIDAAAYRRYADLIRAEADRYGLTLPAEPRDDDDAFDAKIDLLRSDPVPVVSFTFGLPAGDVIRALQQAGTTVVQTVTSAREAEAAASAGVDMLAVQAAVAGGHSGTFTPDRMPAPLALTDLVAQVTAAVALPVIAAGGLGTAGDVAAVLRAGASAAAVGTVLLRADESGASATHKAALNNPSRTETVLTRAFTGRPARGLRNRFIDRYEPSAPLGYPALHHLTSPLRKAAAAAGDADVVHLWAGTGYRHAAEKPTATILTDLAGEV